MELYGSTALSSREICVRCGVSLKGFQCHIGRYHRHLILARYGINRSPEEAADIRLEQLRGQLPATRAKYREAIEACDSMDYIVGKRIRIRRQAVRQQRKGKITGRGTLHAPKPETVALYAEALHLYRTTPMSARRIAAETKVSRKGFYEYLQKWHMDLVCRRKGIPYEEGRPVDWSKVRKYNPATKAKYAAAIDRLKESGLPTAKVPPSSACIRNASGNT